MEFCLIDLATGIPLCENIGHNLLVLASCLSSVWISFNLGFGPLHAWTAAGRLSAIYIPGWISVPHFPKIGRLTAPVGYTCWDFLFSVVLGFFGWTTRQDLFDDFTNLAGPIVGKWTPVIHNLYGWTTTGWSGNICDVV